MTAIAVQDLHFSYSKNAKKKPTLNGINLTVDERNIYALLGPSGCGKTTLLDLIIGIRKAKCGSILLFGYKPKSKESGVPGVGIGYMPQDIALQFNLTIGEILLYFGTLQTMSPREIKKETERLMETFSLPSKNRFIGKLSGGQKRLVSLSVALIHKPRLLILDEPTVGVDPIIRGVFWDHLIDLSVNENVTTVITTHYIHEAQRANVVAFMRKGEILEEGKSDELMRCYNAVSLDDVFLHLCAQQGPRRQSLPTVISDEVQEEECVPKKPLENINKRVYWRQLYTVFSILIWKHFIETKRNPIAMTLLFSVTFTALFAVAIVVGSPPSNLPVAWVVDETPTKCDWDQCIDDIHNQHSANENFASNNTQITSNVNSSVADYEDDLNSSEDQWKEYIGQIPYLPDILRKSINHEVINLVEYAKFSDANDAFSELKVNAIIYLRSNFSENYLRCDPFLIPDYNCDANDTVRSATISLYTEPSNPIISESIRFTVTFAIAKFRKEVAKVLEIPVEVADPLFKAEHLSGQPITVESFHLVGFVTSGFLAIIPFGFSAAISSLGLINQSNLEIRNFASGVTASQVMFSELVAQFILLTISTSINLFAAIYCFSIPCEGSLFLVVLLSLLQVLLGLTFGSFISLILKKSILSLAIATAVLIATFFSSGTIWSIESQPVYLQFINHLFPYTHTVKSMRILLLKEDATFYPQVSNGFVFSILWIIVNYVAANIIAKYKY